MRRIIGVFLLVYSLFGLHFFSQAANNIANARGLPSTTAQEPTVAESVQPATIYFPTEQKKTAATSSASNTNSTAEQSEKILRAVPNRVILRNGVELSWFGHSFVYLVSRNGIRVAIDPFGDDIRKPFPENLQTDVVLISYEGADRNGGERLSGSPQVFRGVLGAGINRARGVIFKGIESWRDETSGAKLGKNIIYTFEMDGIRFCHLGGLGEKLRPNQYSEIGRVDVLFIPVGNPKLNPDQLWKMVHKMEAKWVIPIAYRDERIGISNLCGLDSFIEKYPARRFVEETEFMIRREELPPKPTLLLLKQK